MGIPVHACLCMRVCETERGEREREQDGRSLGAILNPFVETGTVTSECVCDESEC